MKSAPPAHTEQKGINNETPMHVLVLVSALWIEREEAVGGGVCLSPLKRGCEPFSLLLTSGPASPPSFVKGTTLTQESS